jgi:Cu(I)/Ag(I) efflux system membrane fusion protein
MNTTTRSTLLAVAIAAALGGGYWLGRGQNPGVAEVAKTEVAKINPAPSELPAKTEPRILYYRNPMGLPDTSPTPKKDSMGMDYIPVFAETGAPAAAVPGEVSISPVKIQKLGVKSEPAALASVDRVIRAVGRIDVDERRTFTVAPKFEGWIERLHVNATGQPVTKGQPLLDVYSPELVSAQREYAIATAGVDTLKNAGGEAQAGMKQLSESSLTRLKNWDISDEQIAQLRQGGESRRTLTLRSPTNGVVMEKKAVQGMRFMPGDALFQIADLTSVWVVADIFEQDLAQVRVGQTAAVKIDAWPEKIFSARVAYVYPTVNAQTRTTSIRLELANPNGLLKPAMYASIELATEKEGATGKVKSVTVPTSAVIFGGTRNIVLVQLGEGRFAPREVKLGRQGDSHVEVLSGIAEGELVVVSANFLIDSESNLKAAIAGFGVAKPQQPGSGTKER